MKPEVRHEGAHEPEVHHHRPRHLAEKFEGYIGVAMVIAVFLLLGVLIYGIVQTGSNEPSWMH
jgi:hypothetical protein